MIYFLALAWAAAYVFLRRSRAWLLSYVVGAVGFTLIVVYLMRGSVLESAFETAGAVGAHYVGNLIGIPTKVFFNAPGTLLVLIVYQHSGWTAVEVDIECSGLLESIVFIGLVLFFRGLPFIRKVWYISVGLVFTFLVNLLRIVLIVAMITHFGKDAIYLAHTVVGRAVFFLLVINLYWYTFTRTTMETLRRRIMEE